MAYRSPNRAHFAAKMIAVMTDSYLLLRVQNRYIETTKDRKYIGQASQGLPVQCIFASGLPDHFDLHIWAQRCLQR